MRGSVDSQLTLIIDLFTLRLRRGECKYSIYDDNRFIHPRVNFEFMMIINLFTPRL